MPSLNISRRVFNLERRRGPQLPWHIPPEQWTDAHLIAFLTNGRRKTISDQELKEIIWAAPDGVLKALAAVGEGAKR